MSNIPDVELCYLYIPHIWLNELVFHNFNFNMFTVIKRASSFLNYLYTVMFSLLFFQDFFKTNPAPAAQRTIQQSIENIHLNMNQLNKEKDAIKTFLSS